MTVRESYRELPSTQDRAVELARGGAAEGTRVVAARQTAGRGRLDHTWLSPEGGLYLSVVLRAPASPLLPLAIGEALLRLFRDRYGIDGALKWPNDLFVVAPGRPGRKLGGILVDRVASPTLGSAAVAGVGINVRVPTEAIPAPLAGRLAALDEFVRPPPPVADLEEAVAATAVEAGRALATPAGVDAALGRCRRQLYGVGRRATVDGVAVGTIAGIGGDGELLVDGPDGRVAIRAGDLRVED